MKDIGQFVGRYFQAIAWVSLISMIASWFFGRPRVDPTFVVLFWIGNQLAQHRAVARKWTIGVAGVLLAVLAMIIVYVGVFGPDGLVVHIGVRINDPTQWQVVAVASLLIVIVAIPFGLLLSPQAQVEFGGAARSRESPCVERPMNEAAER